MNARERFGAVCSFGSPDRPFQWEWGFWPQTIRRWRNEGLPREIAPAQYFGDDQIVMLPIVSGFTASPFHPPFSREVLKEEGDYRVVRTTEGIVQREPRKDPETSMPEFLKFPVENRADFEKLMFRLDADTPGRYGDWPRLVENHRTRDYPLGMSICGAFGHPRNLLGLNTLLVTYYDDPAFVHLMLDHWVELYARMFEHVLADVELDFVLIWEDMCFKNGPLISPDLFRRFMLPRYRLLTGRLQSLGVKNIWVDSDGNVESLIPLFVEGGVNGLVPFEVQSGMDVVQVRKKYGKKFTIMGGLDKKRLLGTPSDIEEEIFSKVPFMYDQGGYIASLDHTVPPDVSFESFCYYMKVLRSIG